MMLGSPCSPCCGSTECDFSIPAGTDLVTVSVESSVYGPSVYQVQHGSQYPVTSKVNSYMGFRDIAQSQVIGSYLSAQNYFDYDPLKFGNPPRFPWEGAATWARFNYVDVVTSCLTYNGFLPNEVGSILTVKFYGLVAYNSVPSNIWATVNGTLGQQLTDSRLNVSSISQNINFTLPSGFIVDSVVVQYQFIETGNQLFAAQSLPASETLTFRGFYDTDGRQKMYRFAENFPLP